MILVLLVVFFAYLYLWVPYVTAVNGGGDVVFTLDDSYIHLAFARTLAQSGTFGIRPGEPVGGSTSPLWTFWLAPAFWLPISPELWMAAWSMLFTFATFYLLYRLSVMIGVTRLFSLCLVAAYGAYYSTYLSTQSGMEIPMTTAAMLLLFLVLERGGSNIVLGILIAALGLLRPEFYLLGVLVFLYLIINKRLTWTFFPVPMVTLVPYHLWLWSVNGFPLPTTYFAKVPSVITRQSPMEYFAAFSAFLFQHAGLLTILVPAGLYLLLRRKVWISGAWVCSMVAWSSLSGKSGLWTPTYLGNFGRYAMIVIPILFLAGFLVLSRGFESGGRTLRRWIIPASTGLILVLIFMTVPMSLAHYRKSVEDMRMGDIRVARWAAANLPRDAVLVVHDLGAMAYYAPQRLLDLVGIASPEALAYRRQGRLVSFIDDRKPDYLIFIKDWGGFLGSRLKEFPPVMIFKVPNTIIFSSDEIWVCRTPWTRGDGP